MRKPNCSEEYNGAIILLLFLLFLTLGLLTIFIPKVMTIVVGSISFVFMTICFGIGLYWLYDETSDFAFLFEKETSKAD